MTEPQTAETEVTPSGREPKVIKRYAPQTEPAKLEEDIEQALASS